MRDMTFKGGIHPPEYKHITEGMEFSNFSIPQICYIPLQQHIGKPAVPVVNAGEMVCEGQLIGKADGFISANVHSSIPGKVIEIKEHPSVFSRKSLCVVVEAEGKFDSSGKPSEISEWQNLTPKEILGRIAEAGIVGLGGAAFPTPVKLSPPENKKVDTLIINGSECEPYLTVDDMLIRTFPQDIIEGIGITLRVLGVSKAIIGIENNKKEAASILKISLEASPLKDKIQLVQLKTKYPQGAEKQLIYSIMKKEVPSGGLPMDVGVVVQNVGTIYAIREAVALKKPLFERYITVTGNLVNRPGNYKVRIGTRISDIVEECGGLKEYPSKVIMGGPMCGISLQSMDVPVVKGTSGLLFLSEREVNHEDFSPCIKCGRCVSACPIALVPCDIGNAVENKRFDLLDRNVFDCIMCGACSYICPSRRPLSHFVKLSQEKLRKRKTA